MKLNECNKKMATRKRDCASLHLRWWLVVIGACDSELFGAGYVEKHQMTRGVKRLAQNDSSVVSVGPGTWSSAEWFHRTVNHVSACDSVERRTARHTSSSWPQFLLFFFFFIFLSLSLSVSVFWQFWVIGRRAEWVIWWIGDVLHWMGCDDVGVPVPVSERAKLNCLSTRSRSLSEMSFSRLPVALRNLPVHVAIKKKPTTYHDYDVELTTFIRVTMKILLMAHFGGNVFSIKQNFIMRSQTKILKLLLALRKLRKEWQPCEIMSFVQTSILSVL